MHVLILGAAGMIGAKLTERLNRDGTLGDRAITRLTLSDAVPPAPAGEAVIRTDELTAPGTAAALAGLGADVIFHLAAIVSGEAERDFDRGYRINLDGTRALLDAIRATGHVPRLVFASSIAVFGAPFPDAISDDFHTQPLTSYGTQKAIAELLINDMSRRGMIDGVSLRLPTICIRPGTPNAAASGFFSNILREPLAGLEAVLPVADTVRHWFASPRAAVGFLTHAAAMDTRTLGARRALTMPGLSATVGDEIAALGRAAGDSAVNLIRREPDPAIAAIVAGWPERFDAARATALGFRSESSMDQIVAAHIEDEL